MLNDDFATTEGGDSPKGRQPSLIDALDWLSGRPKVKADVQCVDRDES